MSSETSSIPTHEDAERAALLLMKTYGVNSVLLYGSVANGTAHEGSDIDLVAIYDDLNYKHRFSYSSDMETAVSEITGHSANVKVTDRPEWKHRTEFVRNSFESGIADTVVVLADCVPGEVDWGKKIGMPATEEREVGVRLAILSWNLNIMERECCVIADGNSADIDMLLGELCSLGAIIIEHGLKTLLAMDGQPPLRATSAVDLLDCMPDRLVDACSVIPMSILEQVTRWKPVRNDITILDNIKLSTNELNKLAIEYSCISLLFAQRIVEKYEEMYPMSLEDSVLVHTCEKLEKTYAKFNIDYRCTSMLE